MDDEKSIHSMRKPEGSDDVNVNMELTFPRRRQEVLKPTTVKKMRKVYPQLFGKDQVKFLGCDYVTPHQQTVRCSSEQYAYAEQDRTNRMRNSRNSLIFDLILSKTLLFYLDVRGLGGRVISASVFQSAIVRVGRFESRSPLVRATLPTTGASVTAVCALTGA